MCMIKLNLPCGDKGAWSAHSSVAFTDWKAQGRAPSLFISPWAWLSWYLTLQDWKFIIWTCGWLDKCTKQAYHSRIALHLMAIYIFCSTRFRPTMFWSPLWPCKLFVCLSNATVKTSYTRSSSRCCVFFFVFFGMLPFFDSHTPEQPMASCHIAT